MYICPFTPSLPLKIIHALHLLIIHPLQALTGAVVFLGAGTHVRVGCPVVGAGGTTSSMGQVSQMELTLLNPCTCSHPLLCTKREFSPDIQPLFWTGPNWLCRRWSGCMGRKPDGNC